MPNPTTRPLRKRLGIIFRLAGPLAALCLSAVIAPSPAPGANCAKNPSHPSCPEDGDGSGNQKWPGTLKFQDDPGDKITSDGLDPDGNLVVDYVDNTNTGGSTEVFIGSEAKEGDIIMNLPLISGRRVVLNFSTPHADNPALDPDCTPAGPFEFRHMEVNVSDGAGTPQGVYNLGDPDEGHAQSVDVSMRILFDDVYGDLWFLNFGSGERKLCASGNYPNNDVRVEETVPGVDEWTVQPDPQQGDVACLEKHGSGKVKTKFCGSYHMPFFFTFTPNSPGP